MSSIPTTGSPDFEVWLAMHADCPFDADCCTYVYELLSWDLLDHLQRLTESPHVTEEQVFQATVHYLTTSA